MFGQWRGSVIARSRRRRSNLFSRHRLLRFARNDVYGEFSNTLEKKKDRDVCLSAFSVTVEWERLRAELGLIRFRRPLDLIKLLAVVPEDFTPDFLITVSETSFDPLVYFIPV